MALAGSGDQTTDRVFRNKSQNQGQYIARQPVQTYTRSTGRTEVYAIRSIRRRRKARYGRRPWQIQIRRHGHGFLRKDARSLILAADRGSCRKSGASGPQFGSRRRPAAEDIDPGVGPGMARVRAR